MQLDDVKQRILECVARLPVPEDAVPLFGEWDEGRGTVEYQGGEYVYGGVDGGRKSITFTSRDADEFVYYVIRGLTWRIAYGQLLLEKPKIRDHRLFYFPRQIILMLDVSEEWARRLFLEFARALEENPVL